MNDPLAGDGFLTRKNSFVISLLIKERSIAAFHSTRTGPDLFAVELSSIMPTMHA